MHMWSSFPLCPLHATKQNNTAGGSRASMHQSRCWRRPGLPAKLPGDHRGPRTPAPLGILRGRLLRAHPPSYKQGLINRPVRSNRRGPVPVYRTGLAGNRSNSNSNSKSHVQPVPTGLPVGLTSLPADFIGLPVGLIGNRSNLNCFLFWFKFKCPQSILNKYLYNIF